MLGDIIGEIRFLSMKPEEFASSPVLTGVLTEIECLAIYQNISNPRSLPMPHHLSSCRKQIRGTSSTTSFSPEMNSGGSTIDNTEFFYCTRMIKNEIFLQKRGRDDLAAEFTANRTINIKGIILTEMITEKYVKILLLQLLCIITNKIHFLCFKSPEFPNESQNLKLECHLSDLSGSRLASANISTKHIHPRQSFTLEPVFKTPVRVKRNSIYSIKVSVDAPFQCVRFLLGK